MFKWKRVLSSAVLIASSFLIYLPSLYASSIPHYINYQGRLTEQSTGAPINQIKSVTFSLYDTETGGTAIYQQTKQVNIINGSFSVYLGKGEGLFHGNIITDGIPPEVFTELSARYLGIRIENSQFEMVPRQLIASEAYAYKAEEANKADYAQKAGEAENVMGQVHVDPSSGHVGIGTDLPNERLTVEGYLSLKELDSNPSPMEGYGKLYVRPTQKVDSDTKLLLHMDGSEGSNHFADSSISYHLITALGDVRIKMDTKKFGSGSSYFDGDGDYLSIPDSDDWYFDAFTIDAWVRLDSLENVQVIVGQYYSNNYLWYLGFSPTYGLCWSWKMGNGGTGLNQGNTDGWTVNEWHHMAVTKGEGKSNTQLWLDGIKVADRLVTDDIGDHTLDNISSYMTIGRRGDGYGEFRGYMDELRISKGIVRWIADFTSPNCSYSGSGLFYMNTKGEEFALGREMERMGNLYCAMTRYQFGSNAGGVTFHDDCVQTFGSNFMCTGCVNENNNSASSCDYAPQNDWSWYKIMCCTILSY